MYFVILVSKTWHLCKHLKLKCPITCQLYPPLADFKAIWYYRFIQVTCVNQAVNQSYSFLILYCRFKNASYFKNKSRFSHLSCVLLFSHLQIFRDYVSERSGSVWSYKLRYIVGIGAAPVASAPLDPKSTIYRNLYEDTGPDKIIGTGYYRFLLASWHFHLIFGWVAILSASTSSIMDGSHRRIGA